LVYSTFTQSGEAEVTIAMPKAAVPMLLLGNIDALEKAGVQIAGDKSKLETLFSVLEAPDPDFAIVTP
jgi:alkyl sulfatase BDS1-like metallo-beta-lactamase superfamily hydrolase